MYLSRATCGITRKISTDGNAACRLLAEEQLVGLGRTAMRLEKALGDPQDIEWAIDADGNLAVVQSRPITTVVPHAVQPTLVLWSNANVSENFPEPISPLLYSIASTGYYHYFRNLGTGFRRVQRRRLPRDGAGAPRRSSACTARGCTTT